MRVPPSWIRIKNLEQVYFRSVAMLENESEAQKSCLIPRADAILQGPFNFGFILKGGQKVLGYTVAKVEDGDLQILRLTIRRGFRRRGLGRMLIQKLVGLARALKAENLSIALNEWEIHLTKGPLPFLLAVGFKGRGVKRGLDGADDEIVLKLRLISNRTPVTPIQDRLVPA
jgi:GNAT superfamily N-acetyltransferase